jgi:streptomycin 6-kinase
MNKFEKNIIAIYGDRGKKWLTEVPVFVKNLAHQWGLSNLKPVENLTYNYVLSGLQGIQPIILKIGLDHKELEKEVTTLKFLKSPHVVSILNYQTGAMLLEHALPGTSLHPFFPEQDTESLEIACKLMQQLHQLPGPAQGSFPSLADRVALLDKNWNIPDKYLHKARILKNQLLATAPQSVLLHGDFHHGNILQHGDSWIVIDPQAVVGEPAYEIAIFICNPLHKLIESPDVRTIIINRIALAAEKCAIDPARIYDWTFVHSVLAWAWSLEDGRNIEEFARLTKILDTLPTNGSHYSNF